MSAGRERYEGQGGQGGSAAKAPCRVDSRGHRRPDGREHVHLGQWTSLIVNPQLPIGEEDSPRRFRREDGVPAAVEDKKAGRLMMPPGHRPREPPQMSSSSSSSSSTSLQRAARALSPEI